MTGGVRLNDFASLSFRRNIFSALDTSGKSAAPRHHREDCTARTGNRRRAFAWPDASESLFQFVETVASTCQQIVYELETFRTSDRPKFFRAGSSRRDRRLVWLLYLLRGTISKLTKLLLTRRANQVYNTIIARSIESPRGAIRGGLFVCLSPFGRRPHVTTPHLPHHTCASGASRRPSFTAE